jgi:hypothetical protein
VKPIASAPALRPIRSFFHELVIDLPECPDLAVMERGTAIHEWHVTPWREAVATFTNTVRNQWKVSLRKQLLPERL